MAVGAPILVVLLPLVIWALFSQLKAAMACHLSANIAAALALRPPRRAICLAHAHVAPLHLHEVTSTALDQHHMRVGALRRLEPLLWRHKLSEQTSGVPMMHTPRFPYDSQLCVRNTELDQGVRSAHATPCEAQLPEQ